MTQSLHDLFGGDFPLGNLTPGQVVSRSLLIYFSALLVVRLGKSRLLSRASPLDVILAFLLGSLLSRGINGSASLLNTFAAVVSLVVTHGLLTALAFHFHWVGDAVKGKQYLLISDGKLIHENLVRSHISERDLMAELRLNANLEDPGDVQAAYKERSGEVGVVKRKTTPKVVDVSIRDGVHTVRIEFSGNDS